MKGRIAVIDRINGRAAAALIVDGQLEDILIDPIDDDAPVPGAIYRAIADRPVKGQNGVMVNLTDGHNGYLRQAKGISPGQRLLVQVTSRPDEGKAVPVTTRLLFKGRYGIVTPDAAGFNLARSIRDEDERARLLDLAQEVMRDAPDGIGLILRSACAGASQDDITDEIAILRDTCAGVLAEAEGSAAELLFDAPSAEYLAWRDWTDPLPDQVFENEGSFADHGVWELLDQALSPEVDLTGGATMIIEPTRALVAVDINTGADFSFAAGLKANLAAARDLPRQLRLRGLAGQIVVDFAPMGKKERRTVEQAMNRALRQDTVETNLVGWTPLGHMELQRKRDRIPLTQLVASA
ncbi:MAG: ribonuclease E/G [Rhodobacterales bacterium]|jgi:ribonuclease G|nr:ribonuclease E/G [Pseudomonadota bacterium]MDA1287761.1 ribonuclease E/G [Pseudomonadota bacterium]NQW15453.1 ribonuclease E/G [Rhodobacter sp.]